MFPMMPSITPALYAVLNELKVVQYGDFTLASGKKSNIYIDLRLATLHSKASWAIATAFWCRLIDNNMASKIQGIGGPVIGADPIVGAMLALSDSLLPKDSKIGFLVRKEAKLHGSGKSSFIAGPLEPGMKVAMVEDITTTGGSLLSAALKVREFGAEVTCAVSLVDRGEGAHDMLRGYGIELMPVLTMEELTANVGK